MSNPYWPDQYDKRKYDELDDFEKQAVLKDKAETLQVAIFLILFAIVGFIILF